MMLASIIIRTYNEQRHLDELLMQISLQHLKSVNYEVIIVDSGSTDNTLSIAEKYQSRITTINKADFTFGRSLNVGCKFAHGDILVFVSGHCIPANEHWLEELCKPLVEKKANYVYGRQRGKDTTKYSEYRHFDKWFPDYSKLPQEGFFCNNANAAILRSSWEKFYFNEEITGLEDMYLAKLLVESGEKIGYASKAEIFHIHDESWHQVRIRYEREALALQRIMPEVHFNFFDFYRYFISSVLSDFSSAIDDKLFLAKFTEIILFRFNHFWGTYKGSRRVKKLSAARKRHYFYPKDIEKGLYDEQKNSRALTHESQQ
ncbi:glycosyltransferase family 2 protein [Legionella longbeachae]|uniref:glycosyltransferase family 2 protein n=1 Tax=Legionella longbeachae TaxID=450 RepID=UPI00124492A0|nr:glycosyltransferase family 2 protein [Legionella longbeachae]QEY52875.1 glycosyltransferase family 2 protein [Legionella longbeachae]